MGKALEGIRVLDMSHVQAGPSCTQLMGYLGADVIKVELPGRGDITRQQLRDLPDVDSLYFTMLNGNKRGITLNPKTEAGKKILFIDSLKCFGRNGQSLAFFGLILALVALMWERFSAVAFALIGANSAPIASAYLNEILFDGQHLAFTATWFILGGALALFVYALAVVSVPLILDRDADVATAIMTSLRSFALNTGPLLLWAALLVALTLLGFATLLVGLVVIMPILGHASWHAYRELVE